MKRYLLENKGITKFRKDLFLSLKVTGFQKFRHVQHGLDIAAELLRCLDYRALLGLPSYKADSWRRYMGNACQRSLSCVTRVRRMLCMVCFHSCHIYGP